MYIPPGVTEAHPVLDGLQGWVVLHARVVSSWVEVMRRGATVPVTTKEKGGVFLMSSVYHRRQDICEEGFLLGWVDRHIHREQGEQGILVVEGHTKATTMRIKVTVAAVHGCIRDRTRERGFKQNRHAAYVRGACGGEKASALPGSVRVPAQAMG
jgi:hypothetical protein